MTELRNSRYATETSRATLALYDGSEARAERLYIKAQDQVEIRYSWWKDGALMPRPLDLSVEAWLALQARAILDGTLPADYDRRLAAEVLAQQQAV